ncbi:MULTISPECIES: LPS export ABC transporter periplasmic protein LptC [unclassified Iodidimonas]|jgi:lipopolysaccharide export system protein LptC|uniref:LPS export ABC transporter periplasmic protein LptC n=1 Tax=unclassified Iodidimonas TaxID=2626145 RepID=UPI002482CD5A|nr:MULTISPECIES: LPS export ABC transporter periplasmic protein LptC [unclassified Iodidimonas]
MISLPIHDQPGHDQSGPKSDDQAADGRRSRGRGGRRLKPDGVRPYRPITAYDRYVRLMKPLLIFVAVLSAGLSFLWPLFVDEKSSFVFNRETMPRGDQEVRVVGATYRGTDEHNRLFFISAREAVQSSPDAPRVALQELRAQMTLEEGRTAEVVAESGIYDTASQSIEVPGLMHMETSDGYRLDSFGARLDLEKKIISSDRPVEGTGPLGSLRADSFTLDIDQRLMKLDGNMRMRTVPAARSGQSAGDAPSSADPSSPNRKDNR